VVIAVSRAGQRIKGKIGDIVLQAGDTLLLEAHPSFVEQHRNSRDFFLVSPLENSRLPHYERAPLALGIVVGMVALVSCSGLLGPVSLAIGSWRLNLGQVTMFKGAMAAAAMMLLTRCCRIEDARRSIDWQVLVAIAAALGLQHAIDKTGAAAILAHYVIGLAQGEPLWSLAAIYGVSLLITELVSNHAAAALMFPLALATANSLGVNPMPFVVAIMFSASAAFATPLGYQTNLMVYGPGGYRFQDYLRVGVLMNLLVWTLGIAIIPRVWGF
jgi:di/tricarboxylate transporter